MTLTDEQKLALRQKAIDHVTALCEGRAQEYTDAYDANIIVEQATLIYRFWLGDES